MYKSINVKPWRPVMSFSARLSVDIDRDLLKRFKEIVIRKHGKLRTKIAQEVEEALRLYIAKYEKEE
jgi:metal-responsive CopG/Arc/MetJ family transcriptional regulator